jgi:hypothetical protein
MKIMEKHAANWDPANFDAANWDAANWDAANFRQNWATITPLFKL